MRLMHHLLVVEDDPAIRGLLADALEGEGYSVDAASHGLEGLTMARQNPPRAVVLDLMMPVMDGWTFLRERKKQPTLEGVPVVVLSAARELGLQEAKELGASAFLAKPFDLDALLALISRLADAD